MKSWFVVFQSNSPYCDVPLPFNIDYQFETTLLYFFQDDSSSDEEYKPTSDDDEGRMTKINIVCLKN